MTPEDYLKAVEEYNLRPWTPSPTRAALLVIDMQEHFRGLAAPALPSLTRILACCRRAGMPVIYTRHVHDDPRKDGGMLAEWWGDLILEGTDAARLLPEVAPEPPDLVIRKHHYSAFYRTDLERLLKDRKRSEILITGVLTNLCCETTARDAFMRGFRVFFSVDATATASDDLHVSTLKNLSFGFAHLFTADYLEAAFGPGAA